MKQKKTIFIVGIAIIISLAVLGGISTNTFKPVSTNAQTSQGVDFNTMNQMAIQNNESPTYTGSEELAGLIIDNLSVLYIPKEMQATTMEQVAVAHLNGVSAIDESNIVASVNSLASQANAPAYAYTNIEQVKVVRTFLNRLIPELVSPNGPMTDLEAFAVFTATISQKVDNECFQAPTCSESQVNQPFPGSSSGNATVLEAKPESVTEAEMLQIVNSYVNSKRFSSGPDMVSSIGIQ